MPQPRYSRQSSGDKVMHIVTLSGQVVRAGRHGWRRVGSIHLALALTCMPRVWACGVGRTALAHRERRKPHRCALRCNYFDVVHVADIQHTRSSSMSED